jgi:hypothetical protein
LTGQHYSAETHFLFFFLLPFLPLPPFYDEAMPPKKRTLSALKTDGVKTRAAERKELTRR